MFATRSKHNLKAWLLVTFGFLTATAQAATKVAVIDNGVDSTGSAWCSFLTDHGYECTLYPASGPTSSLDSFAVVIDMSNDWDDNDQLLAQVIVSGRGVIVWGAAAEALQINTNSTVQGWVGANTLSFGNQSIRTTVSDSILGNIPPGTEIASNGKLGGWALDDTAGHDEAKVLARYNAGSGPIALLRNQLVGKSVYFSNAFDTFDPVHQQIILSTVEELSVRTIPAISTWGVVFLWIAVAIVGTLVLGRRRRTSITRYVFFMGTILAATITGRAQNVTLSEDQDGYNLQLNEFPPFYRTVKPIQNVRSFTVEDTPMTVVLWEELPGPETIIPMYALFPRRVIPGAHY